MSLSTADIEDLRRFTGYPVAGSLYAADISIQGASAQLDQIIAGLTVAQVALVQTSYLPKLRLLESDLFSVRNTIATDKAAVWTRNPEEIVQRQQIFDWWTRRLCFELGVPPGPGLAVNVLASSAGSVMLPAIFTV